MNDQTSSNSQSVAEVATPNASRYLQQLCKHFAHKLPVTFDAHAGEIDFSMGRCALDASNDVVLRILLSAPDAGPMVELQEIVSRHLVRFAFRESLAIEWRAINAKKERESNSTQGRPPVPPINPFGPIRDPKVRSVIETMNSNRRFPQRGGPRGPLGHKAEDFADCGFSIHPDQGDLIYLLCRQMGARRVVDFATSVGMSAIYFAAAMRDNGGGKVIGSELVPAKAEAAYRNLDAAGLKEFVEIRVGDARQTLRDVGCPVDFVLSDGWPAPTGPSLAREVIEIVAPQLRVGGYVLNDNAEPDFLEFIRDPANGFISTALPIKRGTELVVKIS